MPNTTINITRSAASEARKAQQELLPQLLLQMQQQSKDRAQERRQDKQFAAQQQLLASRDTREESRFLMEQANVKYNRDQAEKVVNSNNALNKWSNEGWDVLFDNLDNKNLNFAYSAKIPNINTNFGGYEQTMTGLNLEANRGTFNAGYSSVAQDYMTRLVNKQNAHIQTIINASPGADMEDIRRSFGNKYSADNVYDQASQVMGTEWVDKNMLYKPTMRKKTFNEIFNPLNIFKSKEIKDNEGNILQESEYDPTKVTTGVVAGTTVVGGGLGTKKAYNNMKANSASYIKDVANDWKTLSAKDFKAKYNMTKLKAGGKWAKNGVFKSSQDIINNARKFSMKKSVLKYGKAFIPYYMAYEGISKITDVLSSEKFQEKYKLQIEAAKIAATKPAVKITTKGVLKALNSPAFKKAVVRIGGKKAQAILLGLGVSQAGVAFPEGWSSLAGAVGTGIAMWQLKSLITGSAELMKHFQE